MISSLVLLFTLQVLWLQNSYDKAYLDFRAETSRMFRGAVLAVRDSSLLQNIVAIPADSISQRRIVVQRLDSTASNPRASRGHAEAQVIINAGTSVDSARVVLRTIASQLQDGRFHGNSQFIIRLSRDSLRTDSIRAHFSRALAKAQMETPFVIKKVAASPTFMRTGPPAAPDRGPVGVDDEKEQHLLANEVQSEWVRVEATARYAVVLSDIRPLLLAEITPQILFGIFLTLLTLASFIFMYRSIVSQQRLMMLKNDFISNITHELKTPIATMSVALEALKNFKGIEDPKMTAEYLDIAQLELGRLSLLTDKVLTTSLLDEQGMSIDFEPVNMEQTMESILRSLKLVIDKHKAAVAFQKAGSDFVVEGHSLHLTNVVYNLLDNALKYSPSEPRIEITLEDRGDEVVFSVADKGLGIPAEYHRRVFEKFFRMPTGNVHNIKGYGLGLSYVDQVVTGHHGKISLTSIPGEGSTFTVTLPKHRR